MTAPQQAMMGISQGAQGEMMNAIQKLTPLQSVKVQQKRRLLEAVTCFDQQNMYVVYMNETTPMFWIQENTPCLQRNCLPPDCGPWNLSYHNIGPQGLDEGASGKHFPEFLNIDRPCSLTCCCFNRPEAIVVEKPSGRMLGKLRDPWACCNFTFQIFDASGIERLKTNTCCCQVGNFCRCPGVQIVFPVLDSTSDSDVATLTKTWMMGDCCPLCFKDWDNFQTHFGQAANPDFKLLLLALTSFIHLRMFSTANQQG